MAQSTGFFNTEPLAVLLVVLGLLLSLLAGAGAWTALSARVTVALRRTESRRALAGAAVCALLAILLLFAGVHSLIGTPSRYFQIAQTADNPVVPQVLLFARLLVFGTALWPPLLCFAIGILLGRSSRGQRRSVNAPLLRWLLFVAQGMAFWWPAESRRGVAGAQQEAETDEPEPEYELTLASGEEVEAEEHEYIANILELGETTARDVMRPRPDVVAVDASWEPQRVLELVAGSTHSRFPVYNESIDEIIGVIHLRDLLEFLARGERVERLELREMLMEPLFVPEGKKADDILRALQKSKSHLAVVLDEYGGTAGILTIEDLLEEIVGDIQDEHDDESRLFYQREDGCWVIDAQVPVDEVNELIAARFGIEDVDTLGGLVTNALGYIPESGETVLVDASGQAAAEAEQAGYRLTVLSTERNRVGQVLIETLPH